MTGRIVALVVWMAGSTYAEETSYRDSILTWRANRESRLKADGGWLTLVGLHDLTAGVNKAGSADHNDIVLPQNAPSHIGTFDLANGIVTFTASPDVTISVEEAEQKRAVTSIVFDELGKGDPDPLLLGSFMLYPIRRSGRYLLRVKDLESVVRKNFRGIQAFPVEESWRLQARFEAFDKPGKISVPSIIGTVDDRPWPGNVHFRVDGNDYTLAVLGKADDETWFTIFADETSGGETYGAGRFIYVRNQGNGRALIDFNKAYNPPCLFTPYATCPLPPSRNRLNVRIEAGERADH